MITCVHYGLAPITKEFNTMNKTHGVSDVNTSDNIKRTAAELAAWRPQVVAEYLALHTGEKATIKHVILHRAAVSSFVSDAMFRQLFVELGFTDKETCGGSEACNDRIAVLLDADPRTVKRIHAQMEKIGLADKPQRRKNRSSVRGFSPLDLTMILKPVLGLEGTSLSSLISERTSVSLLSSRKDTDVPCEPLASDISAPLTLLDEEEEDRGGACASEPDLEIFESFKSSAHPIATERHFEMWHDIGNRWGQSLGVVALHHPVSRADADRLMLAMLDAFAGEPADTLRQAFAATMAELAGRILGRQTSVGFSAMANYARNTLKSEIAKAKLDAARLEAGRQQAASVAEIAISKEKTISDQGIAAHAVAIEAGAKAREARAAAPKEDWRDRKAKSRQMVNRVIAEMMEETPEPERFDDAAPKVADVHGVWISGRDANRIIDAIDGCTMGFVADALFEASGASQTELGAPTKRNGLLDIEEAIGKPPVIKIVEWATKRAKRLMLFAKFGKPQDLCGGPVAHGCTVMGRNGPHKIMMESEYVCISQPFMDGMKQAYPNAWVEYTSFKDESGANSSASAGVKEIHSTFYNLAKSANPDKYGTSLQKDTEDSLEAGIAVLHDAMTRGMRLKTLAEDKFKEEHPNGLAIFNKKLVSMSAAR